MNLKRIFSKQYWDKKELLSERFFKTRTGSTIQTLGTGAVSLAILERVFIAGKGGQGAVNILFGVFIAAIPGLYCASGILKLRKMFRDSADPGGQQTCDPARSDDLAVHPDVAGPDLRP